MLPSYPSALPLLRRSLFALAAMALILTGCIPPGAETPATLTALVLPSQTSSPLPGAVDTAVPAGTETPPASPTAPAADILPIAPPGPLPTRTPLPPYPTPAVFDCAELDLTRADFNQLFANRKAYLDAQNQTINLDGPSKTLVALQLTPTPLIDETLVAQLQEPYLRWQEAADLQPCRITGLWVSSGGWIAVRISQEPAWEDRRLKLPTKPYRAWLVIYHPSTLRQAWVAAYPQGLLNLKWSPSGQQAAVLGGDQRIDIRGAADGAILARLPAPQPLLGRCDVGYPEHNFAWDAGGQRILRKTRGKIETWDAQSASLLGEVPFDDSATSPSVAAGDAVCYVAVRWSPGARYMITNDFGARSSAAVVRDFGPPQIWDAQTGALVRTLNKEDSNIVADPLWGSTDLLYQYIGDGYLRITKAMTGEQVDQQFLMGVDWLDDTAWSPDGTMIASSGIKRLTIYDTRTKQLAFYDYPEFLWDPNFIAWMPGSAQVIIVFNQNFEPETAYLYEIRTGQLSPMENP